MWVVNVEPPPNDTITVWVIRDPWFLVSMYEEDSAPKRPDNIALINGEPNPAEAEKPSAELLCRVVTSVLSGPMAGVREGLIASTLVSSSLASITTLAWTCS